MADQSPEETSAFYEALGRAISEWQLVEFWLAALFARLVTPHDLQLGLTLINGMLGFRDKLRLADTAARHVLIASTMLDEWRTINKRLDELAARRNELAHGFAGFDQAEGKHTLWNAPLVSRKFDPKDIRALQDIQVCQEAFRDAARSIGRLLHAVSFP